eukprot:Skav225480  [mRNA]  locus=scaffold3604:370079:372376:- [translate_table: standard]
MGGWANELISLIKHGCLDTQVFKKIYFQEGTNTEANLEQHGKFLFNLLTRRAKSVIGTYMKPPWRYAALTDLQMFSETFHRMLKEWKLILAAEQMAASGQEVMLLQSMHFLQSALCRLHYLAAERDSLIPGIHMDTSDAAFLAKVATHHVGDTVIIENTHQKVKDLLTQARHETSSRLAKFQSVIRSHVLPGRGLKHLQVDDMSKVKATVGKDGVRPVIRTTNPNSHKMSKRYQEVMKYKASMPGFTWPSTSQDSLFQEVATLELLVHLGQDFSEDKLGHTAITCLMGQGGDIVAHRQSSRLLLVVAVAQFSFLAWDAEVLTVPDTDPDALTIGLCMSPTAIQWHFLESLDDWLFIPSKLGCLHRYGPLVFKQVGQPCDLLAARVQAGLALTIKQCQAVLTHYGISFRSQMRKRDYYMAIFDLFLTTDEEKASALEKSNINQSQTEGDQEEVDSDYEDILEQVEDFNMGDPDLKAEKARLKKNKQQKNMDSFLLQKPRGRGRGRGRGRARGRGRGRAKSKLSEVQMEEPPHTAAVDPSSQGLGPASASGAQASPECPAGPASSGGDAQAAASSGGDAQAAETCVDETMFAPLEGVPEESQPAPSDPDVVAPPPELPGESLPLVPAEDEEKKKKKSTPAPKYHESPHHLLDPLAPPACKLTLQSMDWRFSISFKKTSDNVAWLVAPFKHKSFSKVFTKDNWPTMLSEVHQWGWQKWQLVSNEPDFDELPTGQQRQSAGHIPEETLRELTHWVDNLPTRKKYHKAAE